MIFVSILVGYAVVMIGVGLFLSRRVRETSDFFVAGRSLSPGLVFSTLLAANIGAGSTVGASGLGYREGASAWWWVGSAGIGSLILAFTVGPAIWRVAKERNLYTVGDYLEFRYNRRVRSLVSFLLWFGSLAILAGQLVAMEQIFRTTAGVGRTTGCLLAAIVIVVYFTAGGLHSTARINVLQLVVKLTGFAAALAFLLLAGTGWEGSRAALLAGGGVDESRYFSVLGGGFTGALAYLALLVPSFIISPGVLQKLFAARDVRSVKLGVGANAAGLLLFALIPPLLGMIARARHPDLGSGELALPTLLTQDLPIWLGGLLLGALFSAELSAADAVLFMLTTSLSKDLYKTYLRPEASDQQLLSTARALAVVCGAVGAGLAIWFGSVIAALKIFYTLLSAALLLPLLGGLYLPWISSNAALGAILGSVSVTFGVDFLTGGRGYYGIPPLLWGVAAGAMVLLIVRLREVRSGS
jgi:solute:Na+ symporter, SSS family